MAKLPWCLKVIKSDKEHIEFRLRRICYLWGWIKYRVFRMKLINMDYNG